MRLIDADALKERLEQISVVADDMYGMGINRGLDRADTAIDMMPTVDIKTEVAREIFAEIDKLHIHVTNEFDAMNYEKLKNKYTKEGAGGMKEHNLTDKEFEDFNEIIRNTLNELIRCADKHNIDRDSFIQYFVGIFGAMVGISTFSHYTTTEKGR